MCLNFEFAKLKHTNLTWQKQSRSLRWILIFGQVISQILVRILYRIAPPDNLHSVWCRKNRYKKIPTKSSTALRSLCTITQKKDLLMKAIYSARQQNCTLYTRYSILDTYNRALNKNLIHTSLCSIQNSSLDIP